MTNSGLMICSFYLKTRFLREREELYLLNSNYRTENGEHGYSDVLDMMAAFCEKHFAFSDDEKNMKMFSIRDDSVSISETGTYRAMSFTISSGAYGLESNITDRQTKRVKYRRTINDADIKDFKCVVFIPKDAGDTAITKGILIFQTLAAYGVKTISIKQMRAFFAEINLTLEIRSVSVRTFIEKLVDNGELHKVTLIKNRVSPDSSNNMLITTGREERSYIRPRLKNEWLSKFLNFVENKTETDVFEINDDTYEDIKVTFKLGSCYRTVGLMDIDKFSVVEDIPQTIYNNGRCDAARLLEYMIETANSYKEKMVFTVNQEG